jgi:hypothetical protein
MARQKAIEVSGPELVGASICDKLEAAVAAMPIEWLLEGDSHIRYRALVDLRSAKEADKEVAQARARLHQDALIRRIMDARNGDGYWGRPRDIYQWWPRKDTTFWVLGMLADFGLRSEDEGIAPAVEYVLSTQHACGAFGWGPPATPGDCFTGILTETIAKLGYASDPRVAKAYAWLIQRQRPDGGFWCKNTGQPGMARQGEPSCAFATLCVLAALVQHPQLKDSQVTEGAAAFLLGCWDNRGRLKYAGHDSQIGQGWEKLKYPFTDYRILKYLDALSCVRSAAHDPRIECIVDVLLSKRDPRGCFSPESIHKAWSHSDFGQKGSPSRWITLLAYRALRRLLSYRHTTEEGCTTS